ncbi:thiol:disulfide interchange protein DsbA/DsbL [Pusillimonas sp. CC-YST705]|uniref:Thiol:disulfide interchange protein n=1 Tax=Mesopusillimonas faecipullorum TaxID=2755040 RepID=A0ABS8CF38_9BURK|nr:thiol:disulfide interchange protein DsbA/DsbL [Mesopusillimonas faecipullorum]MCB5364618.1 thiol:disulfide interchange protein DsbA/DsbL [Mesopusillimonas faecipullorum]
MSYASLLSRTFASLVLGCMSLLFLMPAQAQTAKPRYLVLEPAQPSDTPGKSEVLEFFAYSCNHCAAIEPLIEKWRPSLPDNVVFRAVPVAFNASMVDLQKLYYSLESLNRLDLHPKVFKTIHDERKRIFDAKSIIAWAADQGIDRAQFESTFNSFGVQAKVNRANELTKAYKIDGTPTFGVNGKYVVSPSMTGDYQSALDEVSRLLKTPK